MISPTAIPRLSLRPRTLASCILFSCMLAVGPISSQGQSEPPPPPSGEEFQFGDLPYLVTQPLDRNGEDAMPVILFLHGGDRSNIRHHPLRHATWAGIEEFPFLVVAPHCSGSCSWSRVDIDGLLAEVAANFSIDQQRIYLTGYSMGGYGSWHVVTNFPHWFAAAAPIAGGGDPSTICAAKDIPIRAYHGDQDPVITHSQSVRMIEALQACSGDAELVTYKGGDHGVWLRTFKDPEFYRWLLSHRRASAP